MHNSETSAPRLRVAIGKDSHRFLPPDSSKPCTLGGVIFDEVPGLAADSDGDVIFHAICNALTSLTGVPILGGIAIDLCHKDGITDSSVYVENALETLRGQKIEHVALSVEGKRPHLQKKIDEIRKKVSLTLKIKVGQVGLTATSGDGLTEFALGNGLQCFCVIT